MLQKNKIIPVLVVVAMLSFSVRLADIVAEITALSGSAHAQEQVDAEPPEMVVPAAGKEEKKEKKSEDNSSALVFADDDGGADVKEDKKTTSSRKQKTKPSVRWRDASDTNPDYAAVRIELFEDLSKRREIVKKKEVAIVAREALLRAAEQELRQKYQELSQLRAEIENLLEQQSNEESARISSLVKIYEGMKPKDAARIFDTLDIDILISVLGEMSERKLSPILANMNSERARTVTVLLIERKRLPSLPNNN